MAADNSIHWVDFSCPATTRKVKISIYHGGFVTHSLHMGHRMLFLESSNFKRGRSVQSIRFRMPPSGNQAPPGTAWVFYGKLDSDLDALSIYADFGIQCFVTAFRQSGSSSQFRSSQSCLQQ